MDDYRVTLEAFQGPLDLLLFLIRRAEVDVTDIPIADITDQYLEFLRHVEDIDVEMAGEFLVMAATLIELKSRTLVPVPEGGEEDGGGDAEAAGGGEGIDPRHELVRQLLAYQRFRTAADELDRRRTDFARSHAFAAPRDPLGGPDAEGEHDGDDMPVPEIEPELELDDVHVLDLADAYRRIMSSIDFTRLGDHVVAIDDTPIALHQEDLLDRLQRTAEGRMTLQETFAGRPQIQRVGLFLATLELARTRKITVEQQGLDGVIEVVLLREESGS